MEAHWLRCPIKVVTANTMRLRKVMAKHRSVKFVSPSSCPVAQRPELLVSADMVIVVRVRYRFRIEPTGPARVLLARTFGCAQVVFNDPLRCQDEARRAGRSPRRGAATGHHRKHPDTA